MVMNAIILAVLVMVALCMLRVSVVFALIASALVGGLFAGLPMETVVKSFNEGLGGGAPVALAYATLGAFAIALSRTGLSQRLSANLTDRLGEGGGRFIKWAILLSMVLAGIASQTLVPVHIAFIPLLVPPLLHVMNRLQLDRRAVACAITFAITTTYMTLPLGFGAIFLNDILVANINGAGSGELVSREMAPVAMLIPALGMVFGLGLALLWSYRQPRVYADRPVAGEEGEAPARLSRRQLTMVLLALVLALVVQLWTGSMIFGGLVGFSLVSMSGVIRWNEQDGVFLQGMRLMALVGFIMIAASGFAGVMKATGEIQTLVAHSAELVGGNRALAAFMMLLVGLLITMGIGSSFSTVPIIAAIYVPLAVGFGFSPLATLSLVGTAAALGDAGSPASDSTLGPTAGLAADGQHDHIWGTVVPTFLHFNLPLLAFGWVAAMVL
ncbi:Na+/H+ antiporter NhaC family protein [Bacillus subtilis]|nr:Na+/H+ antiporter NhaC family protein [Pseudomonas sp. A29(2023)]MDL5594699.1 Na+/H+ antiporter NhaC family protein [Bacillus subtilis]